MNIFIFFFRAGPNKHQSAVTCLQFNSRFVITSSDDGTVKLWDVRTGDFIRNLVALDSGGSGGVVWRIRLVTVAFIRLNLHGDLKHLKLDKILVL